MRERCKNPHRHRVVNKTQDRRAQGLIIEPPPKETGPERLYRVVYVIDVGAMNPQQAAEHAYEIMADPESMRPVLDVLDGAGRHTWVDLSDG